MEIFALDLTLKYRRHPRRVESFLASLIIIYLKNKLKKLVVAKEVTNRRTVTAVLAFSGLSLITCLKTSIF